MYSLPAPLRKKSNPVFLISNGHCTNRKPGGHYRKTDTVCEFFEENNKKKEKEEQIKSAAELLSGIAVRIDELTQIFELLRDETNGQEKSQSSFKN